MMRRISPQPKGTPTPIPIAKEASVTLEPSEELAVGGDELVTVVVVVELNSGLPTEGGCVVVALVICVGVLMLTVLTEVLDAGLPIAEVLDT